MQIDFIDTIFHGFKIWIKSQNLRFGDLSDEITGTPVICEYILRPVDICNFLAASVFGPCCHNRRFKDNGFFCDR